jgi:hypothetical protein
VRTCFLCGASCLIMPSFVAPEVGPSSSTRMVNLVFRSAMLVMYGASVFCTDYAFNFPITKARFFIDNR